MFATLAGAYPWPAELPPGEALASVVAAQVDGGLALIADGRVHPARTPAADLVAAWTATRDASAAIVAALPVKLAVEGPFAAARGDGRAAGAVEAARAMRDGLLALAGAGCPLVEVPEPAGSLPADEPGRVAFATAHAALLDGLPDGLHPSLAITGGDGLALGPERLFAAPYRSHLLDLLDGPESWRLVAVAPAERGIVVGVGDAGGRGRTGLEEIVWAAAYAASTRGRGMERVGIAPSGSLAHLAPDRARVVIELLGEAAALIAAGRGEILARLDPRAIDARAAALGGGRPGRATRPGG